MELARFKCRCEGSDRHGRPRRSRLRRRGGARHEPDRGDVGVISELERVTEVVRVSEPYRLAARSAIGATSVVSGKFGVAVDARSLPLTGSTAIQGRTPPMGATGAKNCGARCASRCVRVSAWRGCCVSCVGMRGLVTSATRIALVPASALRQIFDAQMKLARFKCRYGGDRHGHHRRHGCQEYWGVACRDAPECRRGAAAAV
jgi:hypothetical protein